MPYISKIIDMNSVKYRVFIIFFLWITCQPGFSQSTRQYDEEIGRLVRKVQQYPGREKYMIELKEVFTTANTLSQDRISALRKTGQPDIWFDIHKAYLELDTRQKQAMQLPEKSLRDAGIVFVNYEADLKESKYRALAYLYAHGEKLLQSDIPENARLAYAEFMKAAGLDKSYKNIDQQIRLAILKGATNVEFELQNRTGKNISPSMIDQLTVIVWEFKKARFGQVKPDSTDMSFVFVLRVVLDQVEIGPDQVRDLEYQEERDIFQGEVVVDTIRCLVRETRQLKRAKLSGSLEYVDKQTGQVVNRVPIIVESIFSNAYASLQGNPEAAGEETKKLLKAGKAEYPGSEQMTRDVTEEFTKKAREIILGE
jgi:hypothetical protein